MGRSVYVPHNAIEIAYRHIERDEHDEDIFWDDIETDVRESLKSEYKSFTDVYDTWIGNEGSVLLENGLCQVGISEYCGLIAVWIIPNEENYNLALNFIGKIAPKFHRFFGQLNKIGTFSNGEAVFEIKNSEV